MKLLLSASGLSHVREIDGRTFDFVVSGTRHCYPLFLAQFVSPRVSSLPLKDSSLTELALATPDPSGRFARFRDVATGAALPVAPSDVLFWTQLFRELENAELLALVCSAAPALTADSVFERIAVAEASGMRCDLEIAFIAEHFADAPEFYFIQCSVPLLAEVLTHPSLKVDSKVSVDGERWEVVDNRNTDDLRRNNIIRAYTMGWELFGRLYEEDPTKK
jgi:hypothetical protein